jgi:hypothetical protein
MEGRKQPAFEADRKAREPSDTIDVPRLMELPLLLLSGWHSAQIQKRTSIKKVVIWASHLPTYL